MMDNVLWFSYYFTVCFTDYLLFMRAPKKSRGWTAGCTGEGLATSVRDLCDDKLFKSVS